MSWTNLKEAMPPIGKPFILGNAKGSIIHEKTRMILDDSIYWYDEYKHKWERGVLIKFVDLEHYGWELLENNKIHIDI
jgi:hypothetical protein